MLRNYFKVDQSSGSSPVGQGSESVLLFTHSLTSSSEEALSDLGKHDRNDLVNFQREHLIDVVPKVGGEVEREGSKRVQRCLSEQRLETGGSDGLK